MGEPPVDLRCTTRPAEDALRPALRRELVELLAPSWEQPEQLLERELTKVTTFIEGRDASGTLLGFSSFGVHRHDEVLGAYVGLGATAHAYKGRGLGKHIILEGCRRAAAALAEALAETPAPVGVVWCTTGSPIGYLGLAEHYPAICPAADGSVPPGLLPTLARLRAELGSNALPEHPCLVRRASEARYTEREHQRLRKVAPPPFFERFAFDERAGDRWILILGA